LASKLLALHTFDPVIGHHKKLGEKWQHIAIVKFYIYIAS